MRPRRNRRLQDYLDEDPMSSLASLFDIAMVFSVALMVAMVNYLSIGDLLFSKEFTIVKNPGEDDMEIVSKQGQEIRRYQADSRRAGQGNGRKIGTAYQLESGEIVYLPD